MKTSAKKTDYQQQALDFLNKTGVKFCIKYVDHKPYFDGDKESRDVYRFTFRRGKNSYSGKFGQSISNQGQEPTAYDVLSCLTKHDISTFEDFCSEFGYDTDSRKALKTYNAVGLEYNGVCRIWNEDERIELAEIN